MSNRRKETDEVKFSWDWLLFIIPLGSYACVLCYAFYCVFTEPPKKEPEPINYTIVQQNIFEINQNQFINITDIKLIIKEN